MSERPVDIREFLQMPVLLTVKRCLDCPCSYDSSCAHPFRTSEETDISPYEYDGPPPEWCPLRKGPLTVQLAPSAR